MPKEVFVDVNLLPKPKAHLTQQDMVEESNVL
jgi:hypothetical protein